MERSWKMAALTLGALATLTLTRCGGTADDASGNVYIPLSDFDTLEVIRESAPTTSNPDGAAYYMDIDLKTGTAVGTYRSGSSTFYPFSCTPNKATQRRIQNLVAQILMIAKGGSTCPAALQGDYEVAKTSSKMLTIDGCHYDYVDNGYQLVVNIINEIEPYCTPDVQLPNRRIRPRLVP